MNKEKHKEILKRIQEKLKKVGEYWNPTTHKSDFIFTEEEINKIFEEEGELKK